MPRKLISFDWAMKKLLRSKANFDILEGFLSELLKEDIHILEILESEGNQEEQRDKFNRVDLKVRNQQDELMIIEVQYDRELDYLQRILFGTSKVLTEHLQEGDPYSAVVKVISVNILYFDLGQGTDYVYHGSTFFQGIHNQDILQLSEKQQALYQKQEVYQIFPEYYLIKVNSFNDIAKDTLDEWIYFLKNEEIKEEFQARGLKKAKHELDIMKLPDNERRAYDRHREYLHYRASMFETSYTAAVLEGRLEGRAEGLKEGEQRGEKKKAVQVARKLLQAGTLDIKTIADMTELTEEEVRVLQTERDD
ncbi:MAG: Rpn family recombination-promoting nuclease/putative transposase [Candidatus Electrothrix aestuarii]|uniref:Rpn family recombination-promoting nuclease/putative transposase n=1 Tax=Candidatus Electrothrix aestuarii TaxID=3062594 RepID=A0AAU8LTR6_9BACT|nr:Rpn family recombination-promoting nuclease/putative transposase [Candidatus Electrothrix aestuarii]